MICVVRVQMDGQELVDHPTNTTSMVSPPGTSAEVVSQGWCGTVLFNSLSTVWVRANGNNMTIHSTTNTPPPPPPTSSPWCAVCPRTVWIHWIPQSNAWAAI